MAVVVVALKRGFDDAAFGEFQRQLQGHGGFGDVDGAGSRLNPKARSLRRECFGQMLHIDLAITA
ncbi:hypothetical protein D3C83_216750 [compost metagenome]